MHIPMRARRPLSVAPQLYDAHLYSAADDMFLVDSFVKVID